MYKLQGTNNKVTMKKKERNTEKTPDDDDDTSDESLLLLCVKNKQTAAVKFLQTPLFVYVQPMSASFR